MLQARSFSFWTASLLIVATFAGFYGCDRSQDPSAPETTSTEGVSSAPGPEHPSSSWVESMLAKGPGIAPPGLPIATFHTKRGEVLVDDYYFDTRTQECLVAAHIANDNGGYDFRVVRIAKPKSPSNAGGFRASIQSPTPGSRIDMEFAASVESDGSIVLAQTVANSRDVISRQYRNDAITGLVTTTTRINQNSYVLTIDPSVVPQRSPGYAKIAAAATTDYESTSLAGSSVDRERLSAMIGDLGFMSWLVKAGGMNASVPSSQIDDVQAELAARWTRSESWIQACSWAGIGTFSGACLPICAPIFVPSISLAAACGVVHVVETIGDWFGWWD